MTTGPVLQRGSILLSIVVAITLLAAVTFMLSYTSVSETNITAGEIQRDRLRYAAEAGLAHARMELAQHSSCSGYTDIPTTSFGADSYSATISPLSGSPVSVTAIGQSADGIEHTLAVADAKAYQSPVTIVFQPGESGQDTYILADEPAGNHGDDNKLMTDAEEGGKGPIRTLLRFDLSTVPYGSRVLLATLDIYQHTESGDGDVVEAHGLLRDWDESANWSTSNGSASWTTPGGDYHPNVESSFVALGIGWKTLDLTGLAGQWIDGRKPNYGVVLLSPPASGNRENIYNSSDDSQSSLRPKQTLVYACECGKTCAAAPGGGKKILLVVGDTANLTIEQQDKKVLMEGWGHTVSLIATSASQAEFDNAAAGVDVIYIPELGTTPMTELGDKADNLPKGVITEEARKAIKLGGFVLLPFVDTTSINIVDNTHYITETLPIGNVELSTTTQSFWKLGGTLAPDLHILGELTGAVPGLAYVDVGETVNDGSPAAGRRVKLPWGSYNFDVNLLTDDGLEIMQRAIEWGASEFTGSGPKNVLFVVGNVGGSGMTAEEIAHQTLIESWGHTVETIDDDASQAEFDAAVANNDVAFTTNDITASRLNTKLVDATIGVVTSEVNLSDEFGMASTIGWDSGTVVEINDNTHYITSPFPTGLLTVLSTSESLAYVTGTLSTDLGQLASSASGYGIVTLETGASMYGGGSAAGRRVQLPWGGNGFSPGNLSADGQTILQRALSWAATIPPLPVCDGNFSANNEAGSFDASGYGSPKSVAYLPPGLMIAGSPLPADGGWAILDSLVAGRIFYTDNSGVLLDQITLSTADDVAGVTFVGSGPHQGKLAFASSGASQLLITDLDGNVSASWNLGLPFNQLDITFIDGGDFAGHFAMTESTKITFIDEAGNIAGDYIYPLPIDTTRAIQYVPKGNLIAVANKSDTDAHVLAFSGTLPSPTASVVNQFDLAQFGVTDPKEGFSFNPIACQYALMGKLSKRLHMLDEIGSGGGGGAGDGAFRDEFNQRSYAGDDGTLSWTGLWHEINESDGPTKQDEQVRSDSGRDYVLRIRDNFGGGEGVEREANMSGCSTAIFSFEYRRKLFDTSTDGITVDVSGDGGDTWSELASMQGPVDDSSYQSASFDISSYAAVNTRIRFLTFSTMNIGEFFVDNVNIDASGCP